MKLHRMMPVLLLALWLTACGAAETPAPEPTATTGGIANVPTLTTLPESAASPTTATVASPAPSQTPLPAATATLAPSATVPPVATVDYITNPPQRPASRGRTTHGKAYPPGAYEFIHDQFDVPAPAGNVPVEYIAALPSVADGTCPLTGEADPNAAQPRRPISVRIDNSADGRPQAGLENADVIWETLAEGGVTRLTATYHCRTVGTVGPIRSARLIDLQLAPMLGGWLVHVGASQQVTDMLWSSPYADRLINEWAGDPAFYRINNPPLGWLATYSNNELITGVMNARGNPPPDTPLRGWLFSDALPEGSTGGATSVAIPYFPNSGSVVSYRYNPASGQYLRYQGQAAHTQQSGQQLAPNNVVVIYAAKTITPIVEDSLGAFSLHFDIVGTGRALLFRNGQVWDATWRREGENVLIRVVDANGNVIPFATGQTIVQIIEDTMTVTWE